MIITLVGPIAHWWDENWDTPEHWHFAEWRDYVSAALVTDGHLVYRPHEAFKGQWNPRAQAVNDTAILVSDLILKLSPLGVPSEGTDDELRYAARCETSMIPAPPPDDRADFGRVMGALLESLLAQRSADLLDEVRGLK